MSFYIFKNEFISDYEVVNFFFETTATPFVDGNKRTGAYSFIWFLEKVKMLDLGKIELA